MPSPGWFQSDSRTTPPSPSARPNDRWSSSRSVLAERCRRVISSASKNDFASTYPSSWYRATSESVRGGMVWLLAVLRAGAGEGRTTSIRGPTPVRIPEASTSNPPNRLPEPPPMRWPILLAASVLIPPSAFPLPTSRAADRPIPPKDAPARMTVPEGFRVALFAGEPDVVQPIAFTFDDRGRMWVVECLSYPKWRADGKGNDRVVILEDADGDGRFDKKTVFLDT